MGEILTDLALTGETQHDIDFIRFNDARPGLKDMMHSLQQGGPCQAPTHKLPQQAVASATLIWTALSRCADICSMPG